MAKEQSPLERVATEMAEHCEMSAPEIETALKGLLENARETAATSLFPAEDNSDEDSLVLAQQYWALAELITQFGSALKAFDDMEERPDGGLPN